MKRFLLPLLLSACGFIANPVLAAPFRFDIYNKTRPDETYDYCKKLLDSSYWFVCDDAPEPHVDLEKYYILFIEDIGICDITAYSKDFIPFSDELNSKVDRVAYHIKLNYGEWTKRLDNYYGYDWNFDNIRSGVSGIKVMASHPDRSRGHVRAMFDLPCTQPIPRN